MLDISSDTATASATATVCENLATFGAAPERGELDSREVWDEDDAIEALGEAIRVMVDGITVDGTQMADEREALRCMRRPRAGRTQDSVEGGSRGESSDRKEKRPGTCVKGPGMQV